MSEWGPKDSKNWYNLYMETKESEFKEVTDVGGVFFTPLNVILGVFAFVILFFFVFVSDIFIEVSPYFYILVTLAFIILGWLVFSYNKIRQNFWKTVALKYGWKYEETRDIDKEKGLIFQIGHSKSAYNTINGNYLSKPFNFFEYKYSTGSGKNQSHFYFTVFEVKFDGTFPHLYLNYKKDWSSSISFSYNMASIPLPSEFAKIFKLYSPKEYEIETLQIFTPDVFQMLLDFGWDYDMEFVDGELIIYRSKGFSNFKDLDKEVERIKKIVSLFAPLLNRMKLSLIGDITPEIR